MPVAHEEDTARHPERAVADEVGLPEGDPQVRRDRRLGDRIIGGLVGAVLIAAVVGVLGLRGGDELDPMFEPTDVATALPVGEAAEGAGATGDVAGVPVGFPQSVDGAVSAMMTYGNAADAALFRTPQERAQIADRIFTDEGHAASGLTDQAAAEAQDRLGADALTGCAYEFGAYKVASVGSSDAAQVPFWVVVSTWAPCLAGAGGAQDASDVDIRWTQRTSTLRWDGRDWRVEATVSSDDRVPVPAEPDDVAVTFEERARLVGKGWTLPADATEEVAPDFWSGGTR
ncbi:hypothetical protein ACH47X_06435 [Promicromonospora kroppenstedtii]|uniref:Conjugative transposon protein TcpC n=1 Tax=Promicromonospora kroppenstedtii TaxID=440482 RepID=A0ABW7XH03_9MICO